MKSESPTKSEWPDRRLGKTKIKILLVDDHPFVRDCIRACLLCHEHLDIVGDASNGQEAINQAKKFLPDIVVMDITMPGMGGLEATRWLRDNCPRMAVLILSVHEKKEFVREVVLSGARGYLRKNASPEELVSAIERIHRGGTFFVAEVVQEFVQDYVLSGGMFEDGPSRPLSKCERRVLRA
jgi:two-component system, NarL family, nitrate/nitrite response regulator NarL